VPYDKSSKHSKNPFSSHLLEENVQCVAVCCSVLQCAAVCCSVLQRVAACCSVLHQAMNDKALNHSMPYGVGYD